MTALRHAEERDIRCREGESHRKSPSQPAPRRQLEELALHAKVGRLEEEVRRRKSQQNAPPGLTEVGERPPDTTEDQKDLSKREEEIVGLVPKHLGCREKEREKPLEDGEPGKEQQKAERGGHGV